MNLKGRLDKCLQGCRQAADSPVVKWLDGYYDTQGSCPDHLESVETQLEPLVEAENDFTAITRSLLFCDECTPESRLIVDYIKLLTPEVIDVFELAKAWLLLHGESLTDVREDVQHRMGELLDEVTNDQIPDWFWTLAEDPHSWPGPLQEDLEMTVQRLLTVEITQEN